MNADFWDQLPVIGMLHLLPLPGSPRFGNDRDAISQRLDDDAAALVGGGVHALMLENFGDAPFFPDCVPVHTVSWMTSLAAEVKERYDVPLGINVLRNDGCAALAIAHAVQADFVRVNVLIGARVTDQGIVSGIAHKLLRERRNLSATDIQILADVNVKHSAALGAQSVEDEVRDVIERGQADAVIVTGSGTGATVDLDELKTVKKIAHRIPVLIGSGVTAGSLQGLAPFANGFIVGTSTKLDAQAANVVDIQRVKSIMISQQAAVGS